MTMANKADKPGGAESNKAPNTGNMVSVTRPAVPEPKKAANVVPAKVPPVTVQSSPSTVEPSKPSEPETIGRFTSHCLTSHNQSLLTGNQS